MTSLGQRGFWDLRFLNGASAGQIGTVGCPRLGCTSGPITCWVIFSKVLNVSTLMSSSVKWK